MNWGGRLMSKNQCEHHVAGTIEMQKMCISIVPIFNHLDASEMSEIVKETNSVKHPRGHTIYHAGDTSDGLYIVHKGRVKIYRLSETGKEQLVRILGPGILQAIFHYSPNRFMRRMQKQWNPLNYAL